MRTTLCIQNRCNTLTSRLRLSTKSSAAKPKPNTRFLQNIVREADSHNAALRAREIHVSRSRLISLQSHSHDNFDELYHNQRVQPVKGKHHSTKVSRRHTRPLHKRMTDDQARPERTRQGKGIHKRRALKDPHRQPYCRPTGKHNHITKDDIRERDISLSSDSWEEFIGPLAPTLHRGRGSISAGAAMDVHFSQHYDPKKDYHRDSCEIMSWDQTVEDYRDRHKRKQHDADKLRSVGLEKTPRTAYFCDDEANLKWATKGDTREWDKGKSAGRYVDYGSSEAKSV
ncbi:hypothetical protein EDC01DRAFT_742597 [Geopyxis carbonaria]|nr:hypothetical protein EDC01DRAFT_742597 [Geopyxis carbonaria]